MKFYKFALWKKYIDTGQGITGYAKYALVVLGIAIPNVKYIILVALAYFISSFFIGWWWLNYGMAEAEAEVNNQFNPFAKEVRAKLGVSKHI